MESVRNLFSSDGFMQRGYYYLWNPGLGVVTCVSDFGSPPCPRVCASESVARPLD
jgi:hypothetical protein